MFVTYNVGKATGPQVFIASIMDDSSLHKDSILKSSANNHLALKDINNHFGQKLLLYWPGLFLDTQVAVYDELKYRCNDFVKTDSRRQAVDFQPTLCLFDSDARYNSSKWYFQKDENDPSSVQRQCSARINTKNGKKNLWLTRWLYQSDNILGDPYNYTNCTGLAVDTKGKYIKISDLASLGTEVHLDEQWLQSLGTQTGGFAFGILLFALLLYSAIAYCFFKVQCSAGR